MSVNWRVQVPLCSMSELTCTEALVAYRSVILGECCSAWRSYDAQAGCEVADLVQEAQVRIITRWPQIVAAATNLRAYVRLEARRAAQRHLQKQRRIIPVDPDVFADHAAA